MNWRIRVVGLLLAPIILCGAMLILMGSQPRATAQPKEVPVAKEMRSEEKIWEGLVLAHVARVGRSDKLGPVVNFRDGQQGVRFDLPNQNMTSVPVLVGLRRGTEVPVGFEPIVVGSRALFLFRIDDTKPIIEPRWLPLKEHPDSCTKILINRSVFPSFLS